MDLPPEELQNLNLPSLLKESISIPKKSPQTFYRITLSLILPLSFAILAHSLFTRPIIDQLQENPKASHASQWTKLLFFQFCYVIFLLAFSLLSTSAVVFTVASLYTSKQVTFASTLSAIPSILRRLFITFVWVFLSLLVYNAMLSFFVVLLLIAVDSTTSSETVFFVLLSFFSVVFLVLHVYLSAIWHLASVVSVLEPVYGFAAMKKSYELLKGKTRMAVVLVALYMTICGLISTVFGSIVINGGETDKDGKSSYGLFLRIVVGGILIGGLVIVNLEGLLVQSLLYYVCKSYHEERIDKSALYNHLGGYLGEYYEPLKGSMHMDELEMKGEGFA